MSFSTSERFAPLGAEGRDRLEALSRLDEFQPGQVVLASGQPAEWLYLIAAGAIDVRAGEKTVLALGPGDLFGEPGASSALPEGVRHVARTGTIVRAVPKGPLVLELKAHRPLATGLLAVFCRSLSEKIRAANEIAVAGSSRPPPASASAGRPPHLMEDEVAWLALLGQSVAVVPGETVVREGDANRSFYVVLQGELEVKKRAGAGVERRLALLGPRDLFGFMAFVDGKPRSATVAALGPARLVRIEPDALEKATQLNFSAGFKFLGTLCAVLGRTWHDTLQAILTD